MMRHILTTLAALTLIAPVARADAPTVRTVTVSGPATTAITIGSSAVTYELVTTLDLPQGYYKNLQVKVIRPDATTYSVATLTNHASPTGWTAAAATGSYRTFTASALDLTTQGASYLFRVYGRFDPGTRDGTPMTFTIEATGEVGADATSTASFPMMTTSHLITASGNAALGWLTGWQNSVAVRGASTDNAGNSGIVLGYIAGAGNNGGPNLAAGNTLTFTPTPGFSSDILFVTSRTNVSMSGQPNATLSGVPSAWSPITAPIVATFPYVLSSTGNYSLIGYDVFVPCDALPLGAAPSSVSIAAHAEETKWNGSIVPRDIAHDVSGSAPSTCGTNGSLAFSGPSATGANSVARTPTLTGPFGIAVVAPAMVVVEHPVEATGVSFGAYPNTTDTSFERWSCNFSTVFGSNDFTVAQFLANQGSCRRLNGPSPGTFLPGDTHVVIYTPSWGGLAGTVRADPRWYIESSLPPDWTARHGPNVVSRAYFVGSFELDGTTTQLGDTIRGNGGSWETTYSQALPTSAAPSVSDGALDNGFALDSNGGTMSWGVIMSNSGLWAKNPVVTITVPAGFEVTAVSTPSFSGCPTAPTSVTLPALTDRPLVLRFGSSASPWFAQCNITNIGVDLRADPSYPFVHMETRRVSARVDADNTVQPFGGGPDARTITMLVAAGEDAQLSAESCWQGGSTIFHATAVNRGQQDLTNVELRFTLPPGSTYVSTTLDPAAGSLTPLPSFQFSTNNGGTWGGLPANPDTVTDVRLVGFAIPGLGVTAPRPGFEVTVAPNSVASLTASAWMSSAELGVTPIVYSEVDPCPGAVAVQKFIDRDGDGARDAGEAAPGAGFVFGLSQGGNVLYQATTDASGLATFAGVPVGAYDVVELGTPTNLTNPGMWTATSSPSLVVDPGASPAIDFGNGCACADPSTDPCTGPGTCDDTGECPVGGVAAEDLTRCDSPDPGNPCVMGQCEAGGCVAAPDPDATTCTLSGGGRGGMLGGGNPCIEALGWCHLGRCDEVPVADGTECGNGLGEGPCIEHVCEDGECTPQNVADGTSCQPLKEVLSSLCTLHACDAGACVTSGEVDCSDGDSCTENWCNPSTGHCEETPPDCTSVPYYAPVVDGSGEVVGAIVCWATPNGGTTPELQCDLEQIPDGVGLQLAIDPAYGDVCDVAPLSPPLGGWHK